MLLIFNLEDLWGFIIQRLFWITHHSMINWHFNLENHFEILALNLNVPNETYKMEKLIRLFYFTVIQLMRKKKKKKKKASISLY